MLFILMISRNYRWIRCTPEIPPSRIRLYIQMDQFVFFVNPQKYLFNFYAKEEYKTLTIYLSEYQAGELINKSKVADLDYDGLESAKRGVIAVIPDFELFRVKLIIADDYSKCSTDFPILENVENREYYGRSATQVEGEVPIQRDTEQGLMALIYGEDGLEAIPVKEMEQGNFREKNDYVYYLSFRFEK